MRAIGASAKSASVIAGRTSCASGGAERLEVAGEQAVDQVEAGDVRRRGEEDVEPPERRRRPAEQVVEDVDQQQAGEERRQRHAGGRDDAAEMVDPGARPHRRQHAERHARSPIASSRPQQGQLERGRQPRRRSRRAPAGRW